MKQSFTPDFFESLVKSNTEFISVVDQSGVYKYVSDAAEAVLGYTADDLLGKCGLNFIHQDDVADVASALQAIAARTNIKMPLFRFRAKNGAWRWIDCRATNMLENEAVNGIVTNSRDVTESIGAGAGGELSQAFYHSLFHNHPDSVFTLDKEGFFREVNARIGTLSGYSEQELLDSLFLDYVQPDSFARAQLSLEKVLAGEVHTEELTILTKEGAEVLLSLTLVPVFLSRAVVGIQGIAKDITKNREAENLIKNQAKQLHEIIENYTDPLVVLDPEWHYTYVNSAFAAYFGKDADAFIGKNIWEFSPQLRSSVFQRKSLKVVTTNKPAHFKETFSVFNNGTTTFNINIFPFSDGISVFFRDISFEKGLQAEFEKLSLVVSKTTNGIIILNKEQKIEWINSGFTRLTGYTLAEALEQKPHVIMRGPETDKITASRIDEKFKSGLPFSEEVLNYRKSGEEIWLKLDVVPILNEKRNVVKFICLLTDITDRKITEHKLLQLATDLYKQNRDLQQFTYIVSHNLRAPVANAIGLTSLLHKVPKNTPVFDEALQKLTISLSKLDNVIKDINSLLTIRDSAHEAVKEEVNLKKLFDLIIVDLQREFKLAATISLNIPADCTVYTNSAYLYNIFYSLLINALKYRSEDRPLDIAIRCKRHGKYCKAISVSDNGIGMDMDKIKDHIFTLYRRFHPQAGGKGIGLFLVKAQVEALGGQIEVESKPEAGTTFTVFL